MIVEKELNTAKERRIKKDYSRDRRRGKEKRKDRRKEIR